MALGRAGERMAERVVPQVMERGGLPAEMLSAMAQGTQSPATVFHGSPHRFTKFDSSKIGTGEGAQAYGHGLYLAESRDVAKDYQKSTSKDKFLTPQGLFDPSQLEHLNVKAEVRKGDLDKAIDLAKKYSQPDADYPETAAKAARDLAKLQSIKSSGGIKENKGNLYQVDLPDEQIAKMLDYDKPLSKQPPAVQAWLRSPYNAYRNQLTASDVGGNEPTGAMILGKLQELMSEGKRNDVFTNAANFGAANASRELAEAGIPGVRYLDQGSRATPNITNKRLADLFQKHGGNAEAAVDEMMRSVYNTPKKKAGMREQFMKQLQTQTPKTSNFVVFPGMEDMLRIDQINEQPINSLLQTLGR
jgi:hypothetical protein